MNEELVSIIIPVYNCEKYIRECLDSVVSQNYSNIEVIIIDDESLDKSGVICDEYADKYPFIHVVHQKNAGSGFARNKGLELITGNYYTFVDADDYISRTYVKDMIMVCKKYNAELVECGNVYMLEARNVMRNVDHRVTLLDSLEKIENSYSEHRNTVWGRLYKKEIFGHIRFSDKRMDEDAEYSYKINKICNRMVHYNYCLYGYRSYQESVTRPVLNASIFKKVMALTENKQEKELEDYVNTFLEPIIHRREEKLYYKELYRLTSLYKESSFYSSENTLYKKLNEAMMRGKCSYFERMKLRVKHIISSLSAKYRTIINYKYKLEESN